MNSGGVTAELKAGERFEFGANWTRFLSQLTDERIRIAENSLKTMLGGADLSGKRFIDVGSGSGVFSLAAHRLGATVHSLDYDPKCVACTAELRRRYAPNAQNWRVEEGSALDANHLRSLGSFDIVYSWGVLNHTGNMRLGFENVANLVAGGGLLFISVHNDQGWKSKYWHAVKRFYNGGTLARAAVIATHAPVLLGGRFVARALTGRLSGGERGMRLWVDFLDWVGGYPWECATAGDVQAFFEQRGFRLERTQLVGQRSGCNEFVFSRE